MENTPLTDGILSKKKLSSGCVTKVRSIAITLAEGAEMAWLDNVMSHKVGELWLRAVILPKLCLFTLCMAGVPNRSWGP